MLILSRKIDESILIGENIELTIVDIRGGHVKLGFHAPPEISIHRSEVQERIWASDFNEMTVLHDTSMYATADSAS